MNKIQAIRGMNDLLSSEATKFNYILNTIKKILEDHGFNPIHLPVLEKTELFARSIGNHTDVVEKEMYTFLDRNEESLSLRPEGTAGCVRAAIEHGMLYNQTQKLWFAGPMFRYERPQKGRYRQFYQLDVEVFGLSGPDIDAELIAMTKIFWDKLGLHNHIKLELNSIGEAEERAAYRNALVAYLEKYKNDLDEDSQRRLSTNPLRILDSKAEQTQKILQSAPKLNDYLGTETKAHFQGLKTRLDSIDINYTINPHLVRGLDYYNRTVFEWTSDQLGAQATFCAGGRYDSLVQHLGGDACPAIGFALGIERLILLLDELKAFPELEHHPDVYLITVGEAANLKSFKLLNELRQQNIKTSTSYGEASFKNQFKKADKSGAKLALIIGEDELKNNCISIKHLRKESEQVTISQDKILAQINTLLEEER